MLFHYRDVPGLISSIPPTNEHLDALNSCRSQMLALSFLNATHLGTYVNIFLIPENGIARSQDIYLIIFMAHSCI